MTFESYNLQNKARVVLVPQQDTRSVTVLVMLPVGSRYESKKLSGVSHYIEHLMFKGTKKRKNTLVLTREIDRLGAEYNAFTSKENTGYYIKVDSDNTETALDILSDMLFSSLFEQKEMEREKGPIVEELRMYKDNPVMNIENIFEELLYGGCPLGRDVGGTPENVLGFKRDEVLRYRDAHYTASNMTIVVAGHIGGRVKEWIEKYFGFVDARRHSKIEFGKAEFGPELKKERINVQKKKTDQAQLMLGFPAFQHTAAENPSADIMNTILGGSMSSRLFIEIRERRGLAYMVSSGMEHFRDIGHLFVRIGLEPKNINKAIAVASQEIKKLVEKGVTGRELADAKTHIRGAMTLAMEDSSAQAGWYAREALFFPEIKTPLERMRDIDVVTREDIQRVAEKIFKRDQARVAIIGEVEKEKIIF